MTDKPNVSIDQITNKITSFKQDIYNMLESGMERPVDAWIKDRNSLKSLIDTAQGVAEKYINGAVKMTLIILIDNSLYTLDLINDKIKSLGGSNIPEEEEDVTEEVAQKSCIEAPVYIEPVFIKREMKPHTALKEKNHSNNLIQVQRIFKRSKNGHSYKTFLYLEYNEEMYQLTNNDLKRKNYRGDIYGFQKFLTDKGYRVESVPVIERPDMIRN